MIYKLFERKSNEILEETKKLNDLIDLTIMSANEMRQQMGLDPLIASTKTHITNCKNCGAPLSRGDRCEYCGSYY